MKFARVTDTLVQYKSVVTLAKLRIKGISIQETSNKTLLQTKGIFC